MERYQIEIELQLSTMPMALKQQGLSEVQAEVADMKRQYNLPDSDKNNLEVGIAMRKLSIDALIKDLGLSGSSMSMPLMIGAGVVIVLLVMMRK